MRGTARPTGRQPPTPVGRETGRATLGGQKTGHRRLWWFAIPSMVLVAVFFLLPFVANTAFAFLRWTGFSNSITWAGLGNFADALKLGILVEATWITVVYALISMLVQNVVGLALAKALQRGNAADQFFRAVFFVPVLFSPLAAGYLWAAALQPHGPINSLISLIVPGGFSFSWLGHPVSALISVAIVDGWKWAGLATAVYVAGLNRIPGQLMEAARLDGAGAWRRFWGVEFPLLVPAFTFNLVVTLAGSFSAIDIVFAMTAGGPGTATSVLNVQLYHEYSGGLFSMASALGLVITLLVVVTAVPIIGFLRRREVEM